MCIFIKLGIHVNYNEMMNLIAFGCQRSKVKVIYKCWVCGDATPCVVIFFLLSFQYSITDAKCANKCLKKCSKCCICCKKKEEDEKNYRYIRNQMLISDWPPVGQVTYAALEDEERDIQRIEEDFMSSHDTANLGSFTS